MWPELQRLNDSPRSSVSQFSNWSIRADEDSTTRLTRFTMTRRTEDLQISFWQTFDRLTTQSLPHWPEADLRREVEECTCQHADHRQQDLLHALDWTPPLCTALVTHRVITRRMENGDTHPAVRIDCRRKALVRIERPSYTWNMTSLLKTSDMWLSFCCFYDGDVCEQDKLDLPAHSDHKLFWFLSHECHHHHVWWDFMASCHFTPFRLFLKFEVWFSGLDGPTGRCCRDTLSPSGTWQ